MTYKIRKFTASLFICFLLANLNFPSAEAWEKTRDTERVNPSCEALTESESENTWSETEKASLRISAEDTTSKERKTLNEKQLRLMGILTMLLASTHAGI